MIQIKVFKVQNFFFIEQRFCMFKCEVSCSLVVINSPRSGTCFIKLLVVIVEIFSLGLGFGDGLGLWLS